MRMMCALSVIGLLMEACPSGAQPAKIGDTAADKPALETPGGMTLYVWDGDAAGNGKSDCDGSCAKLWPPFLAGANAKTGANWTLVKRDDGKQQWAYKGRPLYTWSKDTVSGTTNGDGYDGNTWHVARP